MELDITYSYDFDRNYMVIKSSHLTGKEYALQMLEKNRTSGFLPVQARHMDGAVSLWYDITSRQAIGRLFERKNMSAGDIRTLLSGLECAITNARRLLLNRADILLDPGLIYMESSPGRAWFCYFPGSSEMPEKSRELAEFILKHLDHADQEAVALGYGFYDRITGENASIAACIEDILASHGAGGEEPPAAAAFPGHQPGEPAGGVPDFDEEAFLSSIAPEAPDSAGHVRPGSKRSRNNRSRGKQSREQAQQTNRNHGKQNREQARQIQKLHMDSTHPGGSRRKLIAAGLGAAGLTALFVFIVIFARLDLTQTGGLAFLMMALVWLVWNLTAGRKSAARRLWNQPDEPYDEEAFLRELISGAGQENPEEALFPGQAGPSGSEGTASFSSHHEAAPGAAGTAPDTDTENESGMTRFLGSGRQRTFLVLVSEDPRRCRDLQIEGRNVLIGKARERVDLCIPLDVISRVHARIEAQDSTYILTDLNSMNGTSINGERLLPNESREIHENDRISFATVHFRFRVRDYQ